MHVTNVSVTKTFVKDSKNIHIFYYNVTLNISVTREQIDRQIDCFFSESQNTIFFSFCIATSFSSPIFFLFSKPVLGVRGVYPASPKDAGWYGDDLLTPTCVAREVYNKCSNRVVQARNDTQEVLAVNISTQTRACRQHTTKHLSGYITFNCNAQWSSDVILSFSI